MYHTGGEVSGRTTLLSCSKNHDTTTQTYLSLSAKFVDGRPGKRRDAALYHDDGLLHILLLHPLRVAADGLDADLLVLGKENEDLVHRVVHLRMFETRSASENETKNKENTYFTGLRIRANFGQQTKKHNTRLGVVQCVEVDCCAVKFTRLIRRPDLMVVRRPSR